MNKYIKLSSETAGKDKTARLIQYSCRLLWYYIQKSKNNPHMVDKLKSLEYTLSSFRKLLRLGKSIEVLYSAFNSIHLKNVTLQLTTTMSKIASSIFLLTDNIIWIGRSGLATVDTSKWSEISNRYWLYSILLNLCRDFYEIMRIMEDNNVRIRLSRSISLNIMYKHYSNISKSLLNDHGDLVCDTVKNFCDLWIPLNSLGYTKFNPGLIGLLGTISSIAGMLTLINPKLKLLPS